MIPEESRLGRFPRFLLAGIVVLLVLLAIAAGPQVWLMVSTQSSEEHYQSGRLAEVFRTKRWGRAAGYRHGPCRGWHDNGQVSHEVWYRDGKIVESAFRDANGDRLSPGASATMVTLLEQTATFSFNGQPLPEVLSVIRQISNLSSSAGVGVVPGKIKVSVASSGNLLTILREILDSVDLEFRVDPSGTILIEQPNP